LSFYILFVVLFIFCRNTTETVEYVLGDNMRFSIGPYTHYKFNNNNNTCQIYSFICENGSIYPISKNRELLCWLIGYINRVTMTTVVNECVNDDSSIYDNSIYDSSIYHL